MRYEDFPEEIKPYLYPKPTGQMVYHCLGCGQQFNISQLLYTCPECASVLLLEDKNSPSLNKISGKTWQKVFDYRRMLNEPCLNGIFRYYEFIAPIIPLNLIIYLGEGHTPVIKANKILLDEVGREFYFKNDGLNPSASFKDRGMACALSYINYLAREKGISDIVAICASTGDTSASAALYAAYLRDILHSAVLLPKGKVTPEQLSQPLGSGAKVFEIPGVFDDCMKVVEYMAETYNVALLNSKNSWRILGQESFSYEIAQDFDYDVGDKVVVVPIGNAGNITAVMSGFLKFFRAGLISHLPKIVGVQSEHADPVYRFYLEPDPESRAFKPVTVKPSVAQAAMIGNPVSMPRVIRLVEEYNSSGSQRKIFVVQVSEQEIMDSMLIANRNGHVVCTQGGESLAGFRRAIDAGYVAKNEIGILDSTAHMLKFAVFQDMYFNDSFDPQFQIKPKEELKNAPMEVRPQGLEKFPGPGSPLQGKDMNRFVRETAEQIARLLGLDRKQ